MANHHDSHNHFPPKLSRLFPFSLTSCQYQTLTDVAEFTSNNPITKPKKILHETDRINFPKQYGNFFSSSSRFGDSSRRKHKKSGKAFAEYELGSDKIYYSDNSRRKTAKTRRNIKKKKNFSVIAEEECCYAVEKSTIDPRGDFLVSMVEMIVEKQITARRDLELLLNCFLSLNQASCHGIIFDVFIDVCQTLFTN